MVRRQTLYSIPQDHKHDADAEFDGLPYCRVIRFFLMLVTGACLSNCHSIYYQEPDAIAHPDHDQSLSYIQGDRIKRKHEWLRIIVYAIDDKPIQYLGKGRPEHYTLPVISGTRTLALQVLFDINDYPQWCPCESHVELSVPLAGNQHYKITGEFLSDDSLSIHVLATSDPNKTLTSFLITPDITHTYEPPQFDLFSK